MTTLPLFQSALHDVPRIEEADLPVDRWVAAEDRLPADNCPVVVMFRRDSGLSHWDNIAFIRDGQWIVREPYKSSVEYAVCLESVAHWIEKESEPAKDDPRWQSPMVYPVCSNGGADVWILSEGAAHGQRYYCVGGSNVGNCIYYGVSGDPVLHDVRAKGWMWCVQPECLHAWYEDEVLADASAPMSSKHKHQQHLRSSIPRQLKLPV